MGFGADLRLRVGNGIFQPAVLLLDLLVPAAQVDRARRRLHFSVGGLEWVVAGGAAVADDRRHVLNHFAVGAVDFALAVPPQLPFLAPVK